ncbi:MAG: hypothetical protein IKW99_05670 [Bacteroidales bacterium]|nr:hypothetical protein [Bacteroidales bacterium]
MKKIIIPLLVFLLSFGAQAQETGFLNHLSAGIQLGSDGFGIGLAAPLGSGFRARAGYSFLPSVPYRKTVNVPEHPGAAVSDKGRDIPVDAKASLQLSDLEVFLDYYPLSDNGFHVSAGLLFGSRKIVNIKNVTPLPNDYNIIGLDVDGYTVKAVGNNIEGYLSANPARPYLGVGYDIPISADNRYSLSVDIGAFYWGKPELYVPGEPLIGDWIDVRVPSSYLNGHDDGLIGKAERTIFYPLMGIHFYRLLF